MLGADGIFSRLQGGFGILEEMCVNYVHYYPQTDLELCKSAVNDRYLQKYFDQVNRCGFLLAAPGKPCTENLRTLPHALSP